MSLYFLIYVSVILLAALYGLGRFQWLTKPFRALTVFLALTFVSEVTIYILAKYHRPFMYMYHIYAFMNSLSYIAITYHIALRSTVLRKFSVISGVFTCFLAVVNIAFFQPWYMFPSHIIYCNIIFALLFSILIFYYLLTFPEEYSILRNPAFWFAAATPVFQIVTCIYMLFQNLDSMRIAAPDIQQLVIHIHLIFTIILFVIYGFAIYLDSVRLKK